MWMTFPTLVEGLKSFGELGFLNIKRLLLYGLKQNKKTPSLFWGLGFGLEPMQRYVY